ncbi:MAG: hypothetical protein LUD47_01185 [Clostridia bacterium]|nr:hypothetical protein [Clostridia bacterium]
MKGLYIFFTVWAVSLAVGLITYACTVKRLRRHYCEKRGFRKKTVTLVLLAIAVVPGGGLLYALAVLCYIIWK